MRHSSSNSGLAPCARAGPQRWLTAGLLILLVSGCGGGGSSAPEAPAVTPSNPVDTPGPGGLNERPTLATFVLPGIGDNLAFALPQRYPALRFAQALWTRQVPATNSLLVLQQSGRGSVFSDNPGTTESTLVLDISERTRNEGEMGLLGAAFDPEFLTNRFIYLHYSPNGGPLRSRVSRFEWSGNAIDPASELILFETAQPFGNHNGGSIEFGPDGFLYIALGDGGSAGDPLNNAQNASNLLGAILRIDVQNATASETYRIPAGNPWANAPGQRGELWAIGLRNPFRMSFDRMTGDLWAGDVGQSTREEIDLIQRGGNYGWRVFEGNTVFDPTDNTLPDSSFTPPVIELSRNDARSITGGEVYRGSALPALHGSYIYGDFATGNIWSLRTNPPSLPQNALLGNLPNPAFFSTDSNDQPLITSYSDGFFGVQTSSNPPPAPGLSLSDTGLFTDLDPLTPASGLIEYTVNEPAWSDGANGQRWFAVPEPQTIDFSAEGSWAYPIGSLLVQQLNINTLDRGLLRLETRVLVNTTTGWQAYTWLWNNEQNDARLVTDGAQLEIEASDSGALFTYAVPTQGECLGCHNSISGVVLGAARTQQLNASFDYPEREANQLDTFNAISLFNTDIFGASTLRAADLPALPRSVGQGDATRSQQARAYLEVNCAQCHQAGGPTGSNLDLRISVPTADLNAVNIAPTAGDLGLSDAQIIAPGDSARSVLLARMRATDGNRMPPAGSARPDDRGISLIQEWIDTL